jgi:hypothetical protein
MNTENEVIIIEVENKNKIQNKEKEKEKAKEIDNDIQLCYICQEKPINPINPSGCTHIFCQAHLKVN